MARCQLTIGAITGMVVFVPKRLSKERFCPDRLATSSTIDCETSPILHDPTVLGAPSDYPHLMRGELARLQAVETEERKQW